MDKFVPTLTFVTHDGEVHEVDGEEGRSVMNAAIDNLVPGIDADCGGECACATCHVYVDEEWLARVGEPDAAEDAMLDLNPEREHNSRLCCQISVTPELEGFRARIPEFQM